MLIYATRRILQTVPLLLAISLVIFALVSLQPGDPTDALRLNPHVSAGDLERLKLSYGIGQPVALRYLKWLSHALHGDLGYSQQYYTPAAQYVFSQRLPNTLLLSGAAFVLSTLVALPLGILSALRQYSAADYLLTFLSFVGFSTPVFWLGVMLIYLCAVALPTLTHGAFVLPAGGLQTPGIETAGFGALLRDRLVHLILPAVCLATIQTAVLTRFMRASLLDVLGLDFVRTARSKGLTARTVVYRHALRNAIVPIITILGLSIPGLLGGATLTETVFSWPGMGRAIFDALVAKDFDVVMAALTFLALTTLAFNLLADLAYMIADPRIHYS